LGRASTANERVADGWEPFELPGGRIVGELQLVRSEDGEHAYTCGFWRVPSGDPPEPFPYDMAQNETIYVIEGELTIAVEGGEELHLGPGDLASFTAGTTTTWRLSKTPFKEAFVLS
jgi:uncharacterized cupin superfamily protein